MVKNDQNKNKESQAMAHGIHKTSL